MTSLPKREISTPCIGICRLDDATGLCQGCGRSMAQIAAWPRLSEPERKALMAQLPGPRTDGKPQGD